MPGREDDMRVIYVRAPRDVADAIDERRARAGLSQTQWCLRVFRWALEQPEGKIQP